MKRIFIAMIAVCSIVALTGNYRSVFSASAGNKGAKKPTQQKSAAVGSRNNLPTGYVKAKWKEVQINISGVGLLRLNIGEKAYTDRIFTGHSNFSYSVLVKDAYVNPLQPDNAILNIEVNTEFINGNQIEFRGSERGFRGFIYQSYPIINPFEKIEPKLHLGFVAGDPSIQVPAFANKFIADKDGKLYLIYNKTLFYKYNESYDGWGKVVEGIETLAIDPSNKDIFYKTNGAEVQKSMNGGRDWITITNGLPGSPVQGVVINQHNSQDVYALTSSGLYKTNDAGFSWGLTSFNDVVYQLIMNPHDKNICYARTHGGLYISKDAGLTWSRMDSLLPKRDVKGKDGTVKKVTVAVKAITFVDFEKPFLLAMTQENGILKTEDDGVSWADFNDGYDVGDGAYTIFADNLAVYIGGYGSIYRLQTDKQKWDKIEGPAGIDISVVNALYPVGKDKGFIFLERGGRLIYVDVERNFVGLNYGVLPHSNVTALNTSLVNGENRLFAFVENNNYTDINRMGLFYSKNGGLTWDKSITNDKGDPRLYVSPIDSKELWLFTGYDTGRGFRTLDGGSSWAEVDMRLSCSNDVVHHFQFDPTDKNVKYACNGVNERRLYRYKYIESSKQGQWMPMNVDASKIIIATDDNKKIFTDKQMLSLDGGWTWNKIEKTFDGEIVPLYMSSNEIIMFVRNVIWGDYGYLAISHDLGKTWLKLNEHNQSEFIYMNPADSKNIYFGYKDDKSNSIRVAQTVNQGLTWKPFCVYRYSKAPERSWEMPISMTIMQENEKAAVYLGTQDGLYKTLDNGQSWELIGGVRNKALTADSLRVSGPPAAGALSQIEKDAIAINVARRAASSTVFVSGPMVDNTLQDASPTRGKSKRAKNGADGRPVPKNDESGQVTIEMNVKISIIGQVTSADVVGVADNKPIRFMKIDAYKEKIYQAAKEAAMNYRFRPFVQNDVAVTAEGKLDVPVNYVVNYMTAENWADKAAEYKTVNNDQKAMECYAQAIEIDPEYAAAYINRANLFIKLKEFQKALQDLDKALVLNPQHEKVYNSRAAVYYNLKDYPQAVSNFSKAIELNPKNVMYYANRASSNVELKNYELALKDYDVILDMNADYAVAYYGIANVYSLQGKNGKACDNLKKSIAKGFSDFEGIKNNSYLDSMRNESCYSKIMQGR